MIRGNKLYINITNHCDVCCPFCCMKSDSEKQSFMNFDTIHKIMKDMDVPYIVQLEGGEPTTHPQFYLFMEYISTLEKVEEVVIDTNAFTIDRHIDKIVEIAVRNKKRITVKLSYNTYLKTVFSHRFVIKFANYLKNIISACEFIPYVNFAINVRGYTDKELDTLKDELPQEMVDISSFHLFNSYGRAENDKSLPPLRINDVYDEWRCYASDGECFVYLNDIWKCIDKDNRFTPVKQLLGYYYYVEVYKYQGIDMVSESANLVKLYEQKQIANDVVFEMIFHPNGNLNGSWVDNEDILLAYNPYKS